MAASSSVFAGLKRVDAAAVSALNLDPIDDATRKQALDIVLAVRNGGESALLDLAAKFKDLPEGAWLRQAAIAMRIPSDSLLCNGTNAHICCRSEAYPNPRRPQSGI